MFEISGSGKTQVSVLSVKLISTDHYLPPGRREAGEFFLWGGVGAYLISREQNASKKGDNPGYA